MPKVAKRPKRPWSRTRAGEQGTRNQFLADVTPYSAGSDHDDYDSSTIAFPRSICATGQTIYIHTDHDTLQQIDATKLRRVALLGAAAGYVYATLDAERSRALLPFYTAQLKCAWRNCSNTRNGWWRNRNWIPAPGGTRHAI